MAEAEWDVAFRCVLIAYRSPPRSITHLSDPFGRDLIHLGRSQGQRSY